MHGKEKHENREFNLLVSKTKYFPLLNWSSQIENAAETKKNVSFPFALSHVRRMFLFGVPLRFWIKRLLMSGEELSPQLSDFWGFWGNVGKLDLFFVTVFHLWPEAAPALGYKVTVMVQPGEEKLWGDLIVACQDLKEPTRQTDCLKVSGVTGQGGVVSNSE